MTKSEFEFDKFLDFMVRNAKKEAYREFAEKLKPRFSNEAHKLLIDKVLKEMVGDEE